MKNKSGSGLVFAIIILFVILGIVVTLSSITILETKMGQKSKSSVGAFYNSESGVEWALNKISSASGAINGSFAMDTSGKIGCPSAIGGSSVCSIYLLDSNGKVINNANTITDPTSDISEVKAVRSVGNQRDETQRAIEAAVAAVDEKYQSSCTNGGSANNTICVRINRDTGVTKCKYTPTASTWADCPAGGPWTINEITGKYQLSCTNGGSANNTICVRTNVYTGDTKCKYTPTASTWADCPAGDPW
ncbi:MAG: hypothetical protein PHF35_05025 [Candidatus Moranbacteria bacterium]|nr:hypothetical protein [Candidatus Moranbacteria bacterium]